MDAKTYEPIEITLFSHGITYKVSGLPWDCDAGQLVEVFTKMLVLGGFSPEVIRHADGTQYKVEIIDGSVAT